MFLLEFVLKWPPEKCRLLTAQTPSKSGAGQYRPSLLLTRPALQPPTPNPHPQFSFAPLSSPCRTHIRGRNLKVAVTWNFRLGCDGVPRSNTLWSVYEPKVRQLLFATTLLTSGTPQRERVCVKWVRVGNVITGPELVGGFYFQDIQF